MITKDALLQEFDRLGDSQARASSELSGQSSAGVENCTLRLASELAAFDATLSRNFTEMPGVGLLFKPEYDALSSIIAEHPYLDHVIRDSAKINADGHVVSLSLREARLSTLRAIRDLVHLEKLNLSITAIGDHAGLSDLINLKELDCTGSTFRDVKRLSGLARLEDVSLSRIAISNLEGLEQAKNLKRLHMTGTPVSCLNPLSSLVNLEALCIQECPVTDLKPLENHPELSSLWLAHSWVCDFAPIHGHPTIAKLTISPSSLEQARFVEDLPSLKEICFMTSLDVSSIVKCLEERGVDCRVFKG